MGPEFQHCKFNQIQTAPIISRLGPYVCGGHFVGYILPGSLIQLLDESFWTNHAFLQKLANRIM